MKETLRRAREALGGSTDGRRALGRADQAVTTLWLRELGGRASRPAVVLAPRAPRGRLADR